MHRCLNAWSAARRMHPVAFAQVAFETDVGPNKDSPPFSMATVDFTRFATTMTVKAIPAGLHPSPEATRYLPPIVPTPPDKSNALKS